MLEHIYYKLWRH